MSLCSGGYVFFFSFFFKREYLEDDRDCIAAFQRTSPRWRPISSTLSSMPCYIVSFPSVSLFSIHFSIFFLNVRVRGVCVCVCVLSYFRSGGFSFHFCFQFPYAFLFRLFCFYARLLRLDGAIRHAATKKAFTELFFFPSYRVL